MEWIMFEFIAINTDGQASLNLSKAESKIPNRWKINTRFRSRRANPLKSVKKLQRNLVNKLKMQSKVQTWYLLLLVWVAELVLVQHQSLLKLQKEMGALTVGVVTRPFSFEGSNVKLKLLLEYNESCSRYINRYTKWPFIRYRWQIYVMMEAFKEADNVLRQGVQGISDLIAVSGEVNLDFADVKTIMSNQGFCINGYWCFQWK